jgi:non-canonical poly(A) RNA polymerase PAPD5/7
VRFHNEILSFCDFCSPSRHELNDRRAAFEDVKACIADLFPAAKVEIFGSHMTGIITPSSDIDLVMLGVPQKDGAETEQLYALADLIKQKQIASYCEVISSAKVPIVKLDHLRTKIPMDVCCNNSSGLETGAIMRRFARDFPPMRPLTMVLKVFLAQRRMNDTYSGGIGSFLLCGMIASFLQMRTRLEKHRGRPLTWLVDTVALHCTCMSITPRAVCV